MFSFQLFRLYTSLPAFSGSVPLNLVGKWANIYLQTILSMSFDVLKFQNECHSCYNLSGAQKYQQFPFSFAIFFSRLSMLYYFNLSSYSKSCPLIHLSFSSSLLAVFPFHLSLKAKWCSNKHTHIQTHTPQSQALQSQFFYHNPFSATVDIIFGLLLPQLCFLVNTFLLDLDLSLSLLPKYPQQSQLAL